MVKVLESHVLQPTFLKVKESSSGRTHTFEYEKGKITQEDEENQEQLLFLLDKFCVSDKVYHELRRHPNQ